MRGADGYTEAMFTTTKLDDFVPANHPLRPIRIWLNEALKRMDAVFTRMSESDARSGRPRKFPAACNARHDNLGALGSRFSVTLTP